MDSDAGERPSYQVCFRAIGAWLDEQPPAHATLVESASGVLVIRTETTHEILRVERVFSFEEILEVKLPWAWFSGRRRAAAGEYLLGRVGYARALASLGGMLDRARAHAVVVDEVENGLLVGYSYLDASHGYQWRRHTSQMTIDQLAAMASGR